MSSVALDFPRRQLQGVFQVHVAQRGRFWNEHGLLRGLLSKVTIALVGVTFLFFFFLTILKFVIGAISDIHSGVQGAATSIWPHDFIHAHARLHNHHQPIPDLPSSQQLATTTVLSVWIHILQITPVNGVIQFVAFGVWLLSLASCSQGLFTM